jgi:DNA-binding NarL/FixJ family response regulator/cytochrome c553
VDPSTDELVAEAREALRRGDAPTAFAALEPLLTDDPPAVALELAARAHYVDLSYQAAIEAMEHAYAKYRAARDHVGAVRMARTLAPLHGMILGDWAIGSGWLARAQRVLSETDESTERGWVALDLGMFEPDRNAKHERFGEALEMARSHGDVDLELSTLAYWGASLVHAGQFDGGMRLLDEALAAIAGSEVDDFCVIEEIFCQLFSACEHAADVSRADQWISIGESIADRRGLPAVSAFCRTHYGGVLTAAGRWAEADEALTTAIQLWTVGRRSALRVGAITRLADLRVRQGRFAEAEHLLRGLDEPTPSEAARPLAALQLAKGDADRAAAILEAALGSVEPTDRISAPLLELLVEVHVQRGDLVAADIATSRLAACVDCHDSHYLNGAVSLARGRVAAQSDPDRAWCHLRDAVESFGRARMPEQVAHALLESARLHASNADPAAIVEARRAHATFVAVGATVSADSAAQLLRSLGVKVGSSPPVAGVLTKREREVLDLLGLGLSNPEIAERLFISRKTVEHHVSHIFAKLDVRSRAEAAALAARTLVENQGGG